MFKEKAQLRISLERGGIKTKVMAMGGRRG